MIAGQIAAFHRKFGVQGLGKIEIVAMGRGVIGEVAAVDFQSGCDGVERPRRTGYPAFAGVKKILTSS
jgi:hypothetical protein